MSSKSFILSCAFVCIMALIVACSQDSDTEVNSGAENTDNENVDTDEEPADDVGEEGTNEEEITEEAEGGTDNEAPWAYDGDDVHLRMLISVDDETFRVRYKDQIEEQFPNITLDLLPGSPVDYDFLQELFASGDVPDIIVADPTLELINDLDLLMPIDDYIDRSNFDLSVFRDGTVENLRNRDPLGQGNLYGLPIEPTLMVMFYNKDIFDMFAVSYPEDGMTWNDALDVAAELTREHEGTVYKGLQLARSNAIPYTQFGIPGTDPESGEVLFTGHPDTQRSFELLQRLKDIPGLTDEDPDRPDGFYTDEQNVAMWVNNAPFLPILAPVEGFHFDMVTTPEWEDQPNIAPTTYALSFNITKHSEHPDAAWSVISYLASEEGQTVLSRVGSPPTIDSDTAIEQFGAADIEQFGQTYNVQAPFKQQLAQMPQYSPYDPVVTFHGEDFISRKAREFLTAEADVVEYLREMEEEYAAIVEEMKAQQ